MQSALMKGAASGLGAAVLFGLSTPIAKLLLPGSGPFMLAGLLYLGSGLGLLLLAPLRGTPGEAPLGRDDAVPLLGVVVAGGVVAPLLLMYGLGGLPGSTASLLLNLEAPFTIALAVLVFGESLAPREALGAGAVVLGGAALGFPGGLGGFQVMSALAVAGACVGWALDNNLSQRLALHDPVAVVRVKSLAAGTVNVMLALALGERIPAGPALLGALVTGLLGYGLSIVLHLRAMREMGAARQAAFFATAPFAGACAAVPLLREHVGLRELGAAMTMAVGVAVMVRARHGHLHEHEALEHQHAHVHDEHHLHEHQDEVAGRHSHLHRHAPMVHDHPHLPDAHHRHAHRHGPVA
jgi:drug/metabolite transporter (DMT)-like permease